MEYPQFFPREYMFTASGRSGRALRSLWIQAAAFVLANAISLAAVSGGDAHVLARSAQSMQPAAAASIATAPVVIEAPIGAGWG